MISKLPWYGLTLLGAGLHLLLAHFQFCFASFLFLYGCLAVILITRVIRYATYYLLTPGSNYFFKRSREFELYLNTLNSFVFALEIVRKELIGWAESGMAKADQAVLPKVKNDIEAFAAALREERKKATRAAILASRIEEIIRACQGIKAKLSDGVEQSGWELIGEFRSNLSERALTSLSINS